MRAYLLQRHSIVSLKSHPAAQPVMARAARQARNPPFPSVEDDVAMDGVSGQQVAAKDRLDEGYHTEQADAATPTDATLDSNLRTSGSSLGEADLQANGKNIRELFDTINVLEQLGVENLEIPLPKIVVVGDQSAGKSSLIEAISGIRVPRASGTCTRCPLQINISPNNDAEAVWTCQVTLHKKFDYYKHITPKEFAVRFPEADAGFWPWAPKHAPEDTPFKTIRNKNEIEDLLKRAQAATLNPQDDCRSYLAGRSANSMQEFQASFSPNVIRLDISGPNLPNLSFYDLPGVINQTENRDDEHFVKLVKRLVKEYIRQENALVLLCCSMEGDMANSTASKLVRKLGAEKRCMGVLTKPDRLPVSGPEHFKIWKTVLEGDIFELAHGYFVTKQPSQKDLDEGIDHSGARQQELIYFATDKIWTSELAAFKDRFGTDTIQNHLSELLVEQISNNLPRISMQVQAKIDDLNRDLASMPDPPADDSVQIVYEILHKCNSHISHNMAGDRPHHEFKLAWRKEVARFGQALFEMRPTLVVKSKTEQKSSSSFQSAASSVSRESVPINLESDSEYDEPSPSTGRKRQQADNQAGSPSKRQRIIRSVVPTSKRSEFAKRLTLDDIRQAINENTTSGVPGQVDPKAVDHLIVSTVKDWSRPANEFLKRIEEVLHDALHSILREHLHKWSSTELARRAKGIVDDFLRSAFEGMRTSVTRMIALEQSKPMTFNRESLELHRQKELDIFQNARHNARAELYIDEAELRSGKFTEGADRAKKAKAVTSDQLGKDPFATEVDVMSRVRGYYTVASLRLVDHVAQVMVVELFEPCRTELYGRLQAELGVNKRDAMDRCQQLLAEDPERENRRIRKKQERERLSEAQGKLNALKV